MYWSKAVRASSSESPMFIVTWYEIVSREKSASRSSAVLLERSELLTELFRMLGAAARHPTVAVLDDPPTGALEAACDLVRRGVALEAWVRDDPDRRRLLDRHQRPQLGSREE